MNRREELLQKVRDADAQTYWRSVAGWIAKMVQVEPTVMRRVSRRKFGNLGQWIVGGTNNINKACGCLVGSTALELVKARNSFELDGWQDAFVRTKNADVKRYEIVYGAAPDDPADNWCENGVKNEHVEAADAVCELVKGSKAFIRWMTQVTERVGLDAFELQMDIGQENAVELIKLEIRHQLRLRAARLKTQKKSKSLTTV